MVGQHDVIVVDRTLEVRVTAFSALLTARLLDRITADFGENLSHLAARQVGKLSILAQRLTTTPLFHVNGGTKLPPTKLGHAMGSFASITNCHKCW